MKQSKFMSWVESIANIIIGFAINWSANMIILPFFGWNISAVEAFNLGLVFTVVSMVRSFYLRRVFEWVRVTWGNYDPFKGDWASGSSKS